MNLREFRNKIIDTCDSVIEDGRELDDIEVSVQVNSPDGDGSWSTDISIKYDNDGCASGCVILGE